MTPLDYKLFYQRHLPHYQPPGSTLFITFRLAGSLPKVSLLRIDAEARRMKAEIEKINDPLTRKQAANSAQKQLFGKWDTELDGTRHGPRWLSEPVLAKLVCDAMHDRDGRVYTLEAYCVMPNHVHLVCTPLPHEGGSFPQSKIMQSLKGFTARQ